MRSAGSTIILLFSLITSAQAAPIINGGFETANLTGWGCTTVLVTPPGPGSVGGAGVVAGLDVPPVGPQEGHYMAMLATGDPRYGNGLPPGIVSCLGASSAEPGPGVDLQSVDYPPGTYPFHEQFINTSVIWQTFSAKGGSQVSFQWNYLTNDGCGPNVDPFGFCLDEAFVSLNGEVHLLTPPAPMDGGCCLPSGDYAQQSGFITTTLSLPTDGVYVLAFGIGNELDINASSALLIDNVQRIPEPHTLALLGIAFAGIGLARRRKLN